MTIRKSENCKENNTNSRAKCTITKFNNSITGLTED